MDVEDAQGFTALHVASGVGATASVRALLEAAAGADVQTRDGSTPLHLAAEGTCVCVCVCIGIRHLTLVGLRQPGTQIV